MLYIMAKSPLNTRDLEQCSNLKKSSESKVLLIEDAVIAAQKGIADDIINKIKEQGVKVYALKEDLDARGLNNIKDVLVTDYEGFVDLVIENKLVSCM